MANIKSAKKRIDVNNKARVQNQADKSEMRSQIKRVEKLVEAKDLENAKTALISATKVIDKVVQKGIVHKNTGNRQKSRLANKVNNLSA
ncbi:30S ribosomal protein S20 [Lentibacillus sp. Marseille-P4043]|uniref:30S ribosomal protein S20 n=1 Tax=Lentibacillus sp. Marseille-P4043 TaxID=2040293 RepID=UPI000D0B1BBB|nr:30S ribosomal protein S20 [Lentibacillus sp. Marseille-P4043]